jgi:hypothetical protein
MKIKPVRCKSGEMGEQYRIQDSYGSYEEFVSYCETYGIHTRLGFKTIKGCWRSNPLVQSSTNPSDLRRVA